MEKFTPFKNVWRFKSFKKSPLFYAHLFTYLIITSLAVAVNLVFTPEKIWSEWVILGWGLAVLLHELAIFVFSKNRLD